MSRALITIGAVTAAVFMVWFVGFDIPWAVTTVFVVGPISAVLVTRSSSPRGTWDVPTPPTPRGTRLDCALLIQSLAACDRLARPDAVRRLQTLHHNERDDRTSRSFALRRVRTLLGPDAPALLDPHHPHPVSATDVARCLDLLDDHVDRSPLTPSPL
jgi:hypothetical protein